MRRTVALALCASMLMGCGAIPPPVWQTYDWYLYGGAGTWAYGYYPYAYNTQSVVPDPAGPPPAAPPPARKVRTILVQRSFQNCSMDIYSDGAVSNVYNCGWANETPLLPTN